MTQSENKVRIDFGPNEADAHLLRLELEEAGVRALVLGGNRTSSDMPPFDGTELWVAERDLEKARPVLEAWERRRKGKLTGEEGGE